MIKKFYAQIRILDIPIDLVSSFIYLARVVGRGISHSLINFDGCLKQFHERAARNYGH